MTDINKLEELAKAATDAIRDLVECPTEDANVKLDDAYAQYESAANPAAILSLISQYRRMKEALRKIASCTSYAPGDMPDIARQALQSTEQQG